MDKCTLMNWVLLVLTFLIIRNVFALPEKGKWKNDIDDQTKFTGAFKTLFSKSTISFNIHNCKSANPDMMLSVTWTLVRSTCWQEFFGLENAKTNTEILQRYFYTPNSIQKLGVNNKVVEYVFSDEKIFPCNDSSIYTEIRPEVSVPMKMAKRIRRSAIMGPPQYVVPKDGVYLFIIHTKTSPIYLKNVSFTAQSIIEMKSNYGYLSATDWPLHPFYSVMCGLYALTAALWFILCYLKWEYICRMQMWISAVILLSVFETAFYLFKYDYLNKTGEFSFATEYSAELISCSKRSLARVVVIIALMDGIGSIFKITNKKVVGLGVTYMVLSATESYLKLILPMKGSISDEIYVVSLIVVLMDAVIYIWIFSSPFQTTQSLDSSNENTSKWTSVTNLKKTIILTGIPYIVFMLWSINFHKISTCLEEWHELWLEEAFWKLLFFCVLIVIMLIWKPRKK